MDPIEQQFQAAEYKVELQSAELRKELRLGDLVGIQILSIVGLFWVGTAGKLGSSHIMFWLLAVALFYVPSGIVVAHLVQEMPLEGGLYQWAKLRFGPLAGFLAAMNQWIFNLLTISKSGVVLADNVAYALGPRASWISSSKTAIILISTVLLGVLMLLAWRGLGIGKWVNNFGGFGIVALFAALILVAIPRWLHGPIAVAPVAFTFPALTFLNLNLLGKMGFGALGGFDCIGVFAGECRAEDCARPIRISVWLAAPLISAMFIAGTASVLTFVRPEAIDLVSPITQVLGQGAPGLVTPAALFFAATLLAQNALSFMIMIRFPMVAGWDHLLPSWFSRLDPKFKTPIGSILFAGAVGIVFAIFANAGSGNQEAFQLLDNTGGILYAITYLLLFAIPLAARGEKPPLGVRIAAISGLLMTLLYTCLAVFPIVDTAQPWIFTAKVTAVVLVVQILGTLLYRRAARSLPPS